MEAVITVYQDPFVFIKETKMTVYQDSCVFGKP